MWIVLELWPSAEMAMPCMDEDGRTLVLYDYADALKERDDCQEGIIVPVAGFGRRRLEAITEIRRVHPDLEACERWSLQDLEKTCSDLRRIVKDVSS